MKNNPKLLVYILMLSALGINTPLSIVGIISQISEYFNTSIAITGLYVSSFTFTIAACGLFMPIIFSKYERKRTFVFILTVFAIANAIIIFTKNIYVASISRIISAIFYPAFISIALTVCEEIAPEGEEQDYITKILLGISIGSIVGLPITTAIGTVLGYQMAMAWIFLINLVTLILIIIYFPNMEGKSKSYEVPVSSLKSEKFIMGSLGIIMMPIGATIVYSYLPYFLQIVTHVYTYNLSILLFVYGLISISGTWIGGKLIVKNDRVTLIGFQLLCSFVIAAIFFSAEYLIVCILFIFIFGIMDGLGYNLIQYMESSLLPDTPELANGVFLTIVNGGIAIGTAIGGFLVSGYGIMSIFPGGILFLILAFVLLYFVIFRMKIKLKFD
ncbi:MFS transporter [Methanobrevibacter sp.]|uniref:MFS transporter n=1 Tax=Methanobrevibacter sp. TaxID=66852 RepID=UPI00388F5C6A